MKRIAFYGKGGIGKSTLSSNLAAALASTGNRVLLIGCDPKADTTRSLTGKKIQTVLKALEKSDNELIREDIVFEGKFGVACVEAGGPSPGTGCGGLGISLTMEELERLGILEEGWDFILYDVLGDVVCGGFAVPMREHFVDQVYIVTSSDYMSLYAANNIMRSVARYRDTNPNLMGGLIHNRCKSEADQSLVEMFAKKTHCEIGATVQRSDAIHTSDFAGKLLQEHYAQDSATVSISELAKHMIRQENGCDCQPMDDDELEEFRELAVHSFLRGITNE